MKNVGTLLRNWMNGEQLGQLSDFLRPRDPELGALEAACPADEGAQALLTLRRRQLSVGVLYAFWQGLRLNLENFRTPVGTLLLAQDFSQLVRENILFSLPAYTAVQQELDRLELDLDEEALDSINEYCVYLETVGMKVAHYLGFVQGDLLYPMTEPGYVPDTAATQTYRMELEQYLGISLN